MKIAYRLAVLSALVGAVFVNSGGSSRATPLRLAQSSSEACTLSCSNQAASCKRTCPATFNTPCLNACDSQAQTCVRSCQTQ